MARTFYAQCLADLRPIAADPSSMTFVSAEEYDGDGKRVEYLGSFMALDPCGRYHHCLSPNGATSRCESFWEALEKAADRLGGWIETGEGDPTDVFFCLPATGDESTEEETPCCFIGCSRSAEGLHEERWAFCAEHLAMQSEEVTAQGFALIGEEA